MNYIKHLSAFFDKITTDDRLNQSHVSLYVALFQFWNLNRFVNPFFIVRAEVLKLCKLSSLNTYHKCLHELDQFGYIKYFPSHNPLKSSSIIIQTLDFVSEVDTNENLENIPDEARRKIDTTLNTTIDTSHPELDAKSIQVEVQPRRKIDTTINTSNASYLKQYKHINNIIERGKNSQSEILKNEFSEIENFLNLCKEEIYNSQNAKRKKVPAKKEKVNIPETLDEVLTFFSSEAYSAIEAKKFYNYFQSNGWKVGGKSPMKDWQAAARNWMINSQKFNPPSKPGSRNLNNNNTKNYGEPL